MSDYKLVPLEPTPEMEQAGGAVYWKNIEDVREIYSAMLAAAPAVQGEPVYLYRHRDLHDFITCNHERYAKLSAKPHLFETKVLYTAPQPAEQQPELCRTQPCGCVICFCENETQCMGCGAKHCGTHPVGQLPNPVYQQPAEQQPIPSSLAHDASIHLTNWLNMNLCECESGHTCGYTEVRRTRDALLAVAEQQQAPDVGELIEALEELMLRAHPAYVHDDLMREKLIAARELGHAALSSHREQQPAPDVAALVEALELASKTLTMACLEGEVTRRIDAALAAYREGGGA